MKLTREDIEKAKLPDFDKNLREMIDYTPSGWQKVVRVEDSRFKVICAGRRSGKSYYVAYDTIDGVAADMLAPEQKVWIVAPNYDLTQRIWNEVYTMAIAKFKMASQGGLIQRIHNTKGSYLIETVLGTTIEAKSAEEPEKLVGAGLTKIIVDEAALVKEKAWKQSLRPTLVDHKGRAMFISTPKGKNWFWSLYMQGQDKEFIDWKSWRFTSFENEHLDKKELNDMVKDMTEYEYRQEILAEFEETAEQVFRKYRERAVGSYREPIVHHRHQIGIDLGKKSSYTVISVVDENEFPYPLIYWERFKTIDWKLQVQRIKSVWEKFHSLRVRVDATGVGDPVIEALEDQKIRIEPFIYKEISKKQLIDKLAIFIDDGRISYPQEKILLDELETFGREISPLTGRIKYKPLGKHSDDSVHSLALACWGLPDVPMKHIESKPVSYKPVSLITGY